jgi:choloylglycine hydrolase
MSFFREKTLAELWLVRKDAMKQIVAPALAALLLSVASLHACTGISLSTVDGDVVVGRTVEWALSDASHYRLAVFPRDWSYSAQVPEGAQGMAWTGEYGFVTMTAYGQNYGPDGLNESGLYVGMYYLPGFAEYANYDAAYGEISLSVGDFMQWMLSRFRSVDEVRDNLSRVRVVHVEDERFGGAPLPFHWKIADPSGACIVLEIVDGGYIEIYDAFMGVITNAPTYDWHLINLRNYIGLSPEASKPLLLDQLELSPLGAGSGMVGLPGDFTPPSRFIRAAAFTASCRPLRDTQDAIFESFRILDSFNIPLGTVAPRDQLPQDIESATQITTVADLAGRAYYYHTMFNRELRKIDLGKIDFAAKEIRYVDDDSEDRHRVKELFVQ